MGAFTLGKIERGRGWRWKKTLDVEAKNRICGLPAGTPALHSTARVAPFPAAPPAPARELSAATEGVGRGRAGWQGGWLGWVAGWLVGP
eukprot:4338798-Pyramimonas_sp.AAC.1